MSASAPSNLPKRFSAARLEDQEEIALAREPIRMGTPPFSSPDPATDGIRMLPLEGGHGSVGGTDGADAPLATAGGDETKGYGDMSKPELKSLAEERDLDVKRTDGDETKKLRISDYVTAFEADDTKEFKAADWKQKVADAKDQDELDEIVTLYDESDADYATVKAAIDAKQEALNSADDDDEDSDDDDGNDN